MLYYRFLNYNYIGEHVDAFPWFLKLGHGGQDPLGLDATGVTARPTRFKGEEPGVPK